MTLGRTQMQQLQNTSPGITAEAIPPGEVLAELQKILSSNAFRSSHRPSDFLRYVVEKTLEGTADQIKEYTIGSEVFGRGDSFDPRLDPIVRVEATKLRSRLQAYYETEGHADAIRIELPRRGYVPAFRRLPSNESFAGSVAPTDPPAEPRLPAGLMKGSRGRKRLVAIAAFLTVAAAGGAFWYRDLSHRRAMIRDPKSIAVLPFVNLGADKTDEYFSDGLTDELIALLGRVPGLHVVARSSVFQFKGRTVDIREIGRRLNVERVLEGSVQRVGRRVRITAHLAETNQGYRIWSNTYDRDLNDALAIQTEISQALAGSLGVALNAASSNNPLQAPFGGRPSIDSGAYQAYLKGLYFWNKNTAESIQTAIQYFEEARERAPNYAPIYTGLGRCYTALPVFTPTPTKEVIPKIRAAAMKALELDPNFGEAHLHLGEAAFLEYDWATAEQELGLAVKLSPGDAVVHRWQSYYLTRVGRTEEALRETLIAQELDPVSPYVADGVGESYRVLRRYDEAVKAYEKALALDPNFGMARRGLALTYILMGRVQDGIALLERIRGEREYRPVDSELGYAYALAGRRREAEIILSRLTAAAAQKKARAVDVALVWIGLGNADRSFEWLGKAVDEHEIALGLRTDPILDPIRSDARFEALLRRARL